MAYLDVIQKVQNGAMRVWTPPPKLSISQWADEYLYLSPEDSAEAGKFSTDRAPYQRGMLDAITDPRTREVVYCTGSQIGKSLMQKAILGYHVALDPCPIMVLLPTVEMAEMFSKDRLAPMIRDTPVLRPLVADPKSRTSGNTVRRKSFPGGHLSLVGSNAPSELSSRPIRLVLADEVSRYPVSAGTEGDPLFLARQRTVTFWNRKIVMASTPTNEGACRISAAFQTSDQRYYHLPCPHCGEFHVLKWANMVWEGSDPASALMACPHCGALYGDADKLRMLPQGEWRAEAEFRGIAGFHISALYSPWQTFSDVVTEFLLKKDNPQTLKTFINLQLGETFEDRSGDNVQSDVLMKRRELWDHIPEDVLVLTCGVDVQDDRLETTLVGWTGSEQARVVGHYQMHGSPGEPKVWSELDNFLTNVYTTADNRRLRIRATAIDSGGHHTAQVYAFTGTRLMRNVFAIKGRNGSHPIWPIRGRTTKLSEQAKVFIVGVDTAKDTLFSSFAVTRPEAPKYIAFSADLPDEYFRQLTVERRKTTTNQAGRAVRKWVKPAGARNEALDCMCYAVAALEALKATGIKLRLLATRVLSDRYEIPPEKVTPPPEAMPAPVRRPMERVAPNRRRQSSAVL